MDTNGNEEHSYCCTWKQLFTTEMQGKYKDYQVKEIYNIHTFRQI